MAGKAKGQPNRRLWFKAFKKLLVGRYKEPRFIYLGEPLQNGSIIVSNHEGTDAPLSLELYCDQPLRMWGAAEMNSGLIPMYKYQSEVYYHEKKHWNIHAARAFCLVASPLTNIFYKGLNLISTYHDARFRKTLRESLAALKNGESIVIFPEDSKNGYLPELEGFFLGFIKLAEVAYRKGLDVPIYVTYFKRRELIYVIDAPVRYSALLAEGLSRDEIAKKLLDRCNALGRMTFDEIPPEAPTDAAEEKKEAAEELSV